MEELTEGWPFWIVFVVLFFGAFIRGNATYWVGRAIRSGGARSRFATMLERPGMARAERWVRTVGPPAVSLGFLTVGVQTAINLSAGVLRMPQRRWLPAVTVGALLWATLYTTVGLAFFAALLGEVEWWWAVIAVAVIAVVLAVSRRLGGRAEASE
ncbi:MAG: DedA family protein [Dermatophilaceae bacterium]|nr:VTT domain-containing protein [Intrasporangiaceae bacterium]